MGTKRCSAARHSTGLFQKQIKNRNPARSGGYILLFTLWILVAISVSLAVIIKQTRQNSSNIINNHFYPIEQRQLINILNYVIIHSTSYEIEVDPRLIEFDELQAANKKREIKSNRDQNIDFLKELLKATNMELEMPDHHPDSRKPSAFRLTSPQFVD